MSIDKETVKKVASLARLRLGEDEMSHYANEISGILKWIEQLGEVNTDNVEPMDKVMPIDAHWRKDEMNDGGYAEQIVANAPESKENYFVVPKVVE